MTQERQGNHHFFSGRLAETLQAEKLGLPYLGFRIFKWLIALTVLVLVLLVWFAVATYPDQSDYVPDTTSATAAQWDAFDAAKAAWVTQVKDFGQLFLLTPVFPLMGAVLGYIFGRQVGETEREKSPQTEAIESAESPPQP